MDAAVRSSSRERGQVAVFFALLLPVLFGLGAIVIAIGNWYTHGKHLQTKADAGALAGGGDWAFPCDPAISARIDATARLYSGSNNPQVGGVPPADVHAVHNGPAYYDDDSNGTPSEYNAPGNGTLGGLCDTMTLDVKMTEDNSFPLASLMPFFPDIKRKARVEIREAATLEGVLPIAVRAPEPVSVAAVFFDETPLNYGQILRVKYFVKQTGIPLMPGGLQGWTTYNPDEQGQNTWARFAPPSATGVVVAIGLRGACNTNLPAPNATTRRIVTSPAPNCFEDEGFANVNGQNGLCNQRQGAVQIVNCYWATGTWPNEGVQAGLHFIRGYPSGPGPAGVGNGPPELRSAWLENVNCLVNLVPGTAYLNVHPNTSCRGRLRVVVNLGETNEDPPGLPVQNVNTRTASNVEVKWGLVQSDGSVQCDFGANCELQPSSPGATGEVTYSTQGSGSYLHPDFAANSQENAIAIQIRVKESTVVPNPGACGMTLTGFNNNCRWFHVGTGVSSTSVNPLDNGGAAALAAPVQRAFRGNTVTAGSVQWLRLQADTDCDGVFNQMDNEAASQPPSRPVSGNPCTPAWVVDMGLKGGIAQDADEQPILFNDGIGPSQMGAVDCDPNIQQGQEMIIGIIQGCNVSYAKHPFTWSPLCPPPANLFDGYPSGNPGSPWGDATDKWPPIRCIKTRPGSSMNQAERGLKGRIFGNQNQNSCPPDGPGYVRGRNYWDPHTNPLNNQEFGYKDDGPPPPPHATNWATGLDKRLVTIFLTTPDAFRGSGQATAPITGFIEIYITGFDRIGGNGQIGPNYDDPCATPPPTDLDLSGGVAGGMTIWGHILNYALFTTGATPGPNLCNPGNSAQPCVVSLVE